MIISKKSLTLFLFITICYSCNSQNIREIVKDTYYGIEISDPYRNLEDLENPHVKDWLKEKDSLANDYLEKIPNRKKLSDLVQKLGNSEESEIKNIKTAGKGYFFLKREPKSDTYKLFFKQNIYGEEICIYDPNNFKPDSEENHYINYFKPSWDGKKVLISFSKSGEEFAEMRVFDVVSQKMLSIEMKNCLPTYGGAYWLPDNSGISYLQVKIADNVKEAYLNTETVLQKLDEDKPIILFSKNHDPELKMDTRDFPLIYRETSQAKYTISAVAGATPYHDFYYSKNNSHINHKFPWKPLFKKDDKIKRYYQDNDSIVYLTAKDASNFKICKTSLIQPNTSLATTIVSEIKDEVIKSFRLVKDGIIYTTIKNGVQAKLYYFDKRGVTHEIELPIPAGKLSLSSRGFKSNTLDVTINGWLNKSKRYEYNISTKKFELIKLVKSKEFELVNSLVIEELEVPSHDGVLVPLSLIYSNKLKKDSNNSVLMIGYGAYGNSITPSYSEKILSWALEGGVFAVAHVRGGGEKGDAWYKGGFKKTKPNTWKDMIACTQFLIDNKYSSPKKIAINGGVLEELPLEGL